MDIIRLKKNEYIRHLIVWVILSLVISFIDPISGNIWMRILCTAALMMTYMFVYYAEYLYIFPCFFKKSIWKLILNLFLCFIIFEVLMHFCFFYLQRLLGGPGDFDNAPRFALFFNALFIFFFISIVAIGAYQNYISKQKIMLQDKRETTLILKELGFFKNQFNSHVTLNFLNYCYNYMHKESIEGAEVIELFSNMLKHTLNDTKDDLVPLSQEVEYLNNFITLNQKLAKDIYANLNVVGDIEDKKIAPRILITFIENAFKHGDINSPEHSLNISLEAVQDFIKLTVINKKKDTKEGIVSTGVGHYNANESLERFYKNKYVLNLKEQGEYYICELFLPNKNIKYA
jgi:two-component system LytT family sensor kinase